MTNEQLFYILEQVDVMIENSIKLTKRSSNAKEICNNEHGKWSSRDSNSKELLDSDGQS